MISTAADLDDCLRQRDCLNSQLQAVMSYVEGLHREVKSLRQAKRDCIVWKNERDQLQSFHDELIHRYQKLLHLVCLTDQAAAKQHVALTPMRPQKTAAWDGIELESILSSPMSILDGEGGDVSQVTTTSAACKCRVESIVDYKAIITLLNHERQEKEKLQNLLRDILAKVNSDLLDKHRVRVGNTSVFDFTQ